VKGRLSERERETEMRARVVNRPLPNPNHTGESPTANSHFMPLTNQPPNLFIKKKKREREKKKLAGFWRDSGQISPESGGVSSELLFEEYFGEKKSKVVTCDAHDHCSVGQRQFD
jgi:hypothetical protein